MAEIRIIDAGTKLQITSSNETINFIEKEGAVCISDNEQIVILNSSAEEEFRERFYDICEPKLNSVREIVNAINSLIGLPSETITAAYIKTLYESNPNTNAYTDLEKSNTPTTDQKAAMNNSSSPSSSNEFVTAKIPSIGTPTYPKLEDARNTLEGAGVISGGDITDNGDGTFNVSAGTGFIRATNSRVAQILSFDWAQALNQAIPDGTTRYVGIEYNGGSPQVSVRTTHNWNNQTEFSLAVLNREGLKIHISPDKWTLGDHSSLANERIHGVNRIARADSDGGLILGETGTRNIVVSSGTIWSLFNKSTISNIDTSAADTFDSYLGNTLDTSGATQWDNANYDNGGIKTALGPSKYAVLWFFLEFDGDLVMVYGTVEHPNLAAALNESIPATLPDRIQQHGILIGRLIFQNGAATAASIQSAFTTTFAASSPTAHSQLSLDDGTNPHGTTKTDVGLSNVPNIDATDVDNHVSGITNKVYTATEQTKLAGIEDGADVTDTANVDAAGATMNTDTDVSANGWVLDEDDMVSDDDTKVPTQQSVKAYVNAQITLEKSYKGGYDANTNTPDLDVTPIAGIKTGDVYDVTVAGTFFTEDVEIGDTLRAKQDNPTALSHWVIVQSNLTPASIKTQYESNPDTNAYTDAEKTKLSGIATAATANAEISTVEVQNQATTSTDFVSGRRFWEGITHFLTLAWTWAAKQTFTTAPTFSSTTANQILEVDGSKNLISAAKNSGYNLPKAITAEINTGTEANKHIQPDQLQASKYIDQSGSKTYASTSGTNTYTATIAPAITAYSTGQQFCLRFVNGNTGACTINLNTLGAKDLLKNGGTALTGNEIKSGHAYLIVYNGTAFELVGSIYEWLPNSIPLGSLLTSGASFFVNGGAGVYLSMSGTADDQFFFNDSLNKDGSIYDGSDLALKLHCRISTNGAASDTVGLLLDYAFIRNGDNSTTTVTNVAQVNYDVSTEVQDEEFNITLSTMTGVANADTIMITVTRNSTGAGADAYAGNFEILGLEFIKV